MSQPILARLSLDALLLIMDKLSANTNQSIVTMESLALLTAVILLQDNARTHTFLLSQHVQDLAPTTLNVNLSFRATDSAATARLQFATFQINHARSFQTPNPTAKFARRNADQKTNATLLLAPRTLLEFMSANRILFLATTERLALSTLAI